MAVTQYIGSRYVPLFADPIEWTSTKQYEPLTIVIHEGNSYTSKQFVPVGVDIANEDFWALTCNYNAQVEMYRREAAAAKQAADDAQQSADNAQTSANNAQTSANNAQTSANNAQTDIDTLLPKNAFSAENTVKDYIDSKHITPKLFGAVADGITDDTVAMQDFINYCSNNNVIGYIEDSYYISDTITISKDIVINAAFGVVTFDGDYAFMVNGDRVKLVLYDGTFIGNKNNTAIAFGNSLRSAIYGTKIKNVKHGINTRAIGTYGGGFKFINVDISNDTLINNSIAILDSGNDNAFINCVVQDFNVATRTRTGKFYNLHAWVSNSEYYTGSVFAQINGETAAFTDCVMDSLQFGFFEYSSNANCLIVNLACIRNANVATDALIAEHPARVIYNPSKLYPQIANVKSEFPIRLYEIAPKYGNNVIPTGLDVANLESLPQPLVTQSNGLTFTRIGNVVQMTIISLAEQTAAPNTQLVTFPEGFNPISRVEFTDTYGQKRLYVEHSQAGGFLGCNAQLTNATLRGSVVYLTD